MELFPFVFKVREYSVSMILNSLNHIYNSKSAQYKSINYIYIPENSIKYQTFMRKLYIVFNISQLASLLYKKGKSLFIYSHVTL